MGTDFAIYLQNLQTFLSLPRETVPQLTASETRKALQWAGQALGLEFTEVEGVAPTFLLLPAAGGGPTMVLFASWHAEALPVQPAAVEGGERLALATALAGLGREAGSASNGGAPASIVVVPGTTQGSLVLADTLRDHRARLRAPVAFWPRITPRAPRRRRIFLGSRGRVVLGIWGTGVNAYRLRDRMVEELRADAYGPRPLDFELLRKVAQNRDAMDFLEETLEEPEPGAGEDALKEALFAPRGQVVLPQVKHPDRPQAWLILEITENAEPAELLERARRHAGGGRIEMAEGFPWDRISIHHPSAQAGIKFSKEVSEGAEIWPSAPWVTASGIFTRALGTPLAEWGIPIDASVAVRFPKSEQFEKLAAEAAGLIRHALEKTSPERRRTSRYES